MSEQHENTSSYKWGTESWYGRVLLKCNRMPDSNWWKQWSEVKAVWYSMEEWDLELWLNFNSPNDMEKFVKTNLQTQDWVTNTWSSWNRMAVPCNYTTESDGWYGQVYAKMNNKLPENWDWSKHKNLNGVWSCMGEWDTVFWVNAKTPAELEQFVHYLKQFPWVEDTNASWGKLLWNSW